MELQQLIQKSVHIISVSDLARPYTIQHFASTGRAVLVSYEHSYSHAAIAKHPVTYDCAK